MEIVAFWEKRDSIRKGDIGDNPNSHTNREVVKILLQPTWVKPRDKVEKRLKKLRSFEQINTHSEGEHYQSRGHQQLLINGFMGNFSEKELALVNYGMDNAQKEKRHET